METGGNAKEGEAEAETRQGGGGKLSIPPPHRQVARTYGQPWAAQQSLTLGRPSGPRWVSCFLGSRLSTCEEAQPTAEKARERPKGSLALAWMAGAGKEVLREARRKIELFCHMKSRSPSQLIPPLAGKQSQWPLREQRIKAFPKHQTSCSRQAACSGQKSPWTQQGCWSASYTDGLRTSEGGKPERTQFLSSY